MTKEAMTCKSPCKISSYVAWTYYLYAYGWSAEKEEVLIENAYMVPT